MANVGIPPMLSVAIRGRDNDHVNHTYITAKMAFQILEDNNYIHHSFNNLATIYTPQQIWGYDVATPGFDESAALLA